MKEVSYTGPTPVPLPVARQPLYAEIRLSIDSTHAMLIGFNYQNSEPARRVLRAVQLDRVPVPAVRGPCGGDPDADALENGRPRALVHAGDGVAVDDRGVGDRHAGGGDQQDRDVRGAEAETP